MKTAIIISAVVCSFFAAAFSAPSKDQHKGHHTTSMPMHHTENPHMMSSDSSPAPEPEPESEPKAAAAKAMNDKSEAVSMAPHMGNGMMASTEMMPHGHMSTESSMKHNSGHVNHDHKAGEKHHEQDHSKNKTH